MRKVKEGMKWDKWYGCANQISDKTMLCHPLSDFTDFTAPQLTTACRDQLPSAPALHNSYL